MPENITEATPTVALVQGTPVTELPNDLYIPPDALKVFLDTFEGPLDLLLYLIRKQNLDILEIPVAHITTQYISYIDLMNELQLELAAEYLLMAALLAEIKSRMLLPRQNEEADEEDDPRAFLIRKLQEYECIKKTAEDINLLPRYERDVFDAMIDISEIKINQSLPNVELQAMLLTFQNVLQRVGHLSHHQITKEPLSVRERMAIILEKLNRPDNLIFSALFNRSEGKSGVIVSFLAILELNKEGLIDIVQSESFAELWIKSPSSH